MQDLPSVNITHHGLYFQNSLVGAITYRAPLGRRKIFLDCDDNLLPRPLDEEDFEALPAKLQPRAKAIVETTEEEKVERTKVVGGEKIVELARICLGVKMPNLASASLAKSQEFFRHSEACSNETEYLLTFVRADFDGSMIRALRDKGWTCIGWSRPSQAGNRDATSIRERYKWRWLCPISRIEKQTSVADW